MVGFQAVVGILLAGLALRIGRIFSYVLAICAGLAALFFTVFDRFNSKEIVGWTFALVFFVIGGWRERYRGADATRSSVSG